MKVTYSWRNKDWKDESEKNEHWIGNLTVQRLVRGMSTGEIHGCFAAVWESAEAVYLVTDLIGSYPLFYSVTHDSIYISDDALLIAKLTNSKLKTDNISEFRKTGYVTEKETLFQNIYGLNPGTKIIIDKRNGTVEECEWFRLDYRFQKLGDPKKDNIQQFDKCLLEVFSEMADRLDGKTAIIPLSGGLDSRLIATYLKKVGYKNVVCFSYGRRGNWEAEKSQRIARQLEYPWIFVEYTADTWKELMRSTEYYKFLKWSCRGRSIGCLQALPAILAIKERQLTSDDGVVIPGHALDFTLGSHITKELPRKTGEKLIKAILDAHYVLADNLVEFGNIEKWKNSIDIENPVNAYMLWEYHNRQSKFIANDVRTYEYAGYTFELPLWDIRIQRFAMGLSFDELMDRNFQREFTKKKIDPYICLEDDTKSSSALKLSNIIKAALRKNVIVKHFIEWKSIYYRRTNDTNGFLSWLTDEEYKYYSKYLGKKFILNSIEADDYLSQLSKENEW